MLLVLIWIVALATAFGIERSKTRQFSLTQAKFSSVVINPIEICQPDIRPTEPVTITNRPNMMTWRQALF